MSTEKFVVIPDVSSGMFTSGKRYEVFGLTDRFASVVSDNGIDVNVLIDGNTSCWLDYEGRFKLFNVSAFDANDFVVKAGDISLNEAFIRNAQIQPIMISNASTKGDGFEEKCAELVAENNKLRKEREQFKRDCIKAEAIIDRLYDLFPHTSNHDQLFYAIKSSKIFGDAFLEMQKMK